MNEWTVDVDRRIYKGIQVGMDRGFIKARDPIVVVSGRPLSLALELTYWRIDTQFIEPFEMMLWLTKGGNLCYVITYILSFRPRLILLCIAGYAYAVYAYLQSLK